MRRYSKSISIVLFGIVGVLCLLQIISSPMALFLGFVFAMVWETPIYFSIKNWTSLLMKIAVVGLGFGLELHHAYAIGKDFIGILLGSIVLTFILGYVLNFF